MTRREKTPISIRKKLIFSSAVVLTFFALALFAAETALRVRTKLRLQAGQSGTHEILLDDVLGWKPTPGVNDAFWKFASDPADEPYRADTEKFFVINPEGFRRWDATPGDRPAVLVLGDSFTHALYAGEGGAYFDVIAERTPCDLYAFGCISFGNLQETLVLEKHVAAIRPAVVLLQLCGNDIADNDADFAAMHPYWNCGLPRPFLEDDGSIRMRNVRFGGDRAPLWSRSMVGAWLTKKYALYPYEMPVDYRSTPEYARALERTGRILERFRRSCGPDTVVLAYAECPAEQEADFRRACTAAGIRYLDGVAGALRQREADAGGKPIGRHDGPGGHYNLLGHQVIGQALAPRIRDALAEVSPSGEKSLAAPR